MKYDIVIPVAFRDYPFLSKTIKYIDKYLTPTNIYIVTNFDKSCCLPSSVKKNKSCVILNEDLIIKNVNLNTVINYIQDYKTKNNNAGWFFQQFIKMGFSLSEYCLNDYYLSWDVDTLPLCQIDFFNEKGEPYFSMKSEHNQPYFDTIKELLGNIKINKQSYIAEHMMFNKQIMISLINNINTNDILKGNNWVEKIIKATNPNDNNSFSEFETYGNYCMNFFPDVYVERYLPSFRGGSYISGRFISDKILKELSFDISTISFELYHKPRFPWNMAIWAYNIYIKYFLYKKFRIKQKLHLT